MKVLAGDVGGTNTRLAVCEVNDGRVEREFETVAPSDPERSFKDIVRGFLSEHAVEVRSVCFGLPGPVRGRRAQLTNLPWVIDADELERELGLPTVTLVNDLEANAYGLSTLDEGDIRVVREGVRSPGNAGLVSAGTGLGQAGMQYVEGKLRPFPTEGGHASFAPSNELEIDLLRFLQARFGGHVSWERVVSGPGLVNIYAFFEDRENDPTPGALRDEMRASDPAAVIARHAMAESDARCRRALDLFLELYGAEAGNVALKVLAIGGIYLGGGIIPKIADVLPSSGFLRRFDDKGRMKALVEQIPIRMVLDDKAALQGAALHAANRAKPQ